MKMPKVIMHNSVSLDGSFTDFEGDAGLHYQIAGEYKYDLHLFGSITAKTGMEMYGGEIPPEDESDFNKPDKPTNMTYWVIPDTRGILMGLLHVCRRDKYCRDVKLLISNKTPREYVQYLEERQYDYLVCGDEHVDYKKAFGLLNEKYGAETILVDAGPTLNRILLENGLIDEISLLIAPVLVGRKSSKWLADLFDDNENIKLELLEYRAINDNYILLRYKV